jgi:hypothetical protein
MAENKKAFVAYCDWLESFEELTDEEAGKLAKHLFRYVNDLKPGSTRPNDEDVLYTNQAKSKARPCEIRRKGGKG